MDHAVLVTIAAVVALLLLSAFFSGAETAVTAASRARLLQLEHSGSAAAAIVNRLLMRRERLIGAVLLGNNLVNILASSLATSLLISLFGDAGVVYATVLMTAFIVIFSEILPKTYAIHRADRVALAVAPGLRIVVAVLAPVTETVLLVVRFALRLAGAGRGIHAHLVSSADELRGTIALQTREGRLVKQERDMLGSILDLAEVRLSEVMVHRTEMYMIDIEQGRSQIVELVLQSPHSRIPVWRGDPENIVGVLNSKDVLHALAGSGGTAAALDVAALATEPWFVPETTTLREQLGAFRRERRHLALVVDEYGALMGLVTVADILEEIVGELADEREPQPPSVRAEPGGSYVVDGAMTIRDLNRQFDWALPDEEASTIAGLILHEARIIPERGQVFRFHGFEFEILRRARNRIRTLRIRPPRAGPSAASH
ncbi:MAG: HlyC/CorC family transporter [Alphaproteobacteria bacterium]|nr:HlyC/CorC family transporter [Alphaproteobacteria bacterium]